MPPPKLPKLVPWHSPAEFIQVYNWFYPEPTEDGAPDIRSQECALRRVKAWEARGKLPHAIDSTASFMQVVIRDWTGTLSDQELRLMYSMVFIRFVNGYVDGFQSSKSAKSIAYLAVEKVGMPISFVELRHTATHDYLPSLTSLRRETNEAIGWLKENYWDKQLVPVRLDETPSEEMLSAMTDDVRRIIEAYKINKEKQIEENNLSQPKTETHIVGRLVRDLIKRCRSGDELLETLVPVLLEPGMLVPKSKKSRASGRDLSLHNLGRMVDLCWMPLMNKLHHDLRNTSSKDGEAVSFWARLLNDMLDKLIEANNAALAVAQFRATDEEKAAAKTGSYLITILAWIKYLIKLNYDQQASARGRATHSSASSGSNSPSLSSLSVNSPTISTSSATRPSVAALAAQLVAEQTLANQPPVMLDQDDILDLVEACLTNSGLHVSPLIRSVLNTVIEADADIKEKIGPLLKQIDQRIVSGSTSSIPAAAANSTIPTPTPPIVADARGGVWQEGPALAAGRPPQEQRQDEDTTVPQEEAMEGVEDTSAAPATPAVGAWTLFEEEAWRPCPMGCLPGGILPDLTFPWEMDPPAIARLEV
ncbi:ribosomal biogenesis protein LAS1 [Entomortierella parvispora]|uniref:Ribosomal biogenesis protein LAS1 n=1 Tax=Entomortierella parvispora TaxID=205924 RepID=A0A9P3LZ95_9FUNG|nr:ribosomal biogenesis protein LAS1 [Entomortierella parvispora]